MSSLLTAIALALAVQQPTPSPVQQPPLQAGPPERELTPAHDLFFEEEEISTYVARASVHSFGRCVADRSTELASEVLRRDFRSRGYDSGLQRLARNNQDCFRGRGRMRSANLLFAGAVAEGLLKRAAEPVNVQLARAALRPAAPVRHPAERVALCVVRSLPDETARLFATDVASAEEAAALRTLAPAVQACSQFERRLEANSGGLRAILASAALRSIHGAAPADLNRRD